MASGHRRAGVGGSDDMRPVSVEFDKRIIKKVQTKATNADPRIDLWISRPTTQLIDDELLEKQSVTSGATDCDIAVRHEHFGRKADGLAMAYVKGGVAKVATSPYYESMKRHAWIDSGFNEPAQKVAIAYDGTMPRDLQGRYEFITKGLPWVFWINSGAVYGKQLGGETIILAENNATAISAVRAMWSDVPGFDFGLCLFMILNGTVYVRQLINGEWYDAEVVPTTRLPALEVGNTWSQISASRTWDYRIALQLVDSTGKIYEVFTQFGGIGSKNAEHIEVKGITSADGKLTYIPRVYWDAKTNDEHIEVKGITSAVTGLYSIADPVLIEAHNVSDAEDNWGKIIHLVFNVHIADPSTDFLQFSLTDAYGKTFTALSAVNDVSGKKIILTFNDFNNAHGECEIAYTAGTITSMYGTAVPTASVNFTPTNLVPTEVILPKVEVIWNE